ncbi:unnamed protein product [Medioppia subpectinata]|uniref:Protein lin-10 n=1 Tax=Medioppia subpectinata TaxID=1979941 RepID=A0A7R9KTH9_9ACAR|nr:unnamed protein product [Medioppia subpectinata]CAG2108155.1 unnamed protein product [Medioppia subpectinata]
MANESNDTIDNTININSNDITAGGHEISDQLIEKLFPKCRPKTKTISDLNENYKNCDRNEHILIDLDLDLINDNNTMNDTKQRDKDCVQTDNNCIKNSLTNIGFKLDQLLLSPEEEYKPLNYNFHNKPMIDSNDDIDFEEASSGKDMALRESRIEIAGGREIFSASKNKMNKRRLVSHHNNNTANCDEKVSQNVAKCKRNNTTQTLVPNSDSNQLVQNNDIFVESYCMTNPLANQLLHQQMSDVSVITDGKSVEHKHKLLSGIVVYEDFTSKPDSEIIYDDIEEMDKTEHQLSVKPIDNELQNSGNTYMNCVNESLLNGDSVNKCDQKIDSFETSDDCEDNEEDKENNTLKDDTSLGGGNREIARIIGNVPIAQYDGSPRRYGPKPPGYPQRVINNEDMSVGLANCSIESKGLVDISCDELVKSILSIPTQYEESPTNSCTNVSNGSKSHSSGIQSAAISEHESDKNDVIMETSDMNVYQFSDLDYKLYRMGSVGNAYVGKRLATLSSANSEDDNSVAVSPSKSVNNDTNDTNSMIAHENELILLHERVRQHILSEMVSVDRSSVSTGADTEPEPEVSHRPQESNRNFTLSPDITDCDSNEIESELSLEGSLLSNSKIAVMPVLEDGLSSGVPSSDNELDDEVNSESPTNISNSKKQICERLQEELVSKLKAKLKHNDNLLEHQNNYNHHSSNLHKNASALNHSETYRKEANDTQNYCHELENKSMSDETRDKEMNRQNNETNDINNSIWIPRSNELNGNKPVNANTDDSTVCEPTVSRHHDEDCDTDQETDRLLGAQRTDDRGFFEDKSNSNKRSNATREAFIHDPSVLIEGVLFRARYLGSTQLVCEGQPTKATRMMQAEEAVSRIKAPEGETQPSTDVDLFISTEKIMVLNTDLKEIMMDHSLRTISYIADIGDLLVLMARRRILNPMDETSEANIKRIPKMICHIFESEEAQFIAQSIGQAFQVAYMEFLKANGIEDSSFVKEMDYQEVLNSQQIFGNELEMFAKKEKQKEVIVPKQKGEILGVVVVESGWGSMLPTVVIANMAQQGPSARCGQLNIGDQIIAINGVSLVGLPLSTCQTYIKNTKNQTVVKFTVVPCPPVVEVKIKRPDTKYQLGFSVQNGVICSLLRGGIAERGGVRVGHRIIEINGQSVSFYSLLIDCTSYRLLIVEQVVAVPHDRIVNLLATSVGEILMKTMPTSMFRLLTGQEMPTYM